MIPFLWSGTPSVIKIDASTVIDDTYRLLLDGKEEGFFRRRGELWMFVRHGKVRLYRTLKGLLEDADVIILEGEH